MQEELPIMSASYSAQGRGFEGGSPKDSFGPCVTWLVSSWQDGMVAHLSEKFPSVLAYSPKQLTSKWKLPFY